jgi:hypothetical protein
MNYTVIQNNLAYDKAYQGLQGPSGSTKGLSITKDTHMRLARRDRLKVKPIWKFSKKKELNLIHIVSRV